MKPLLPLLCVAVLGCQTAGVAPVAPEVASPQAPDGLGETPATSVLQANLDVRTVPAGKWRISEVLSVQVDVALKNAVPGSQVAVEFVTPGGAMWMRKQAEVAQGQSTLTFELPVSGTLVQDHEIAGHWRVRTELDGVELAVREVSLQP